nr:calmodulin-binding protein 60 A-like [Tanacetum cinerariifolium]
FEGDNNSGSVGSISSVDEFQRDNASGEVEMELMMRIYKETICPMICAEINAKQQKFLPVIREKFGVDLLTGMPWNFCNTPSTCSSQALQLQFINGISTPVATGNDIKGKGNEPFVLALVNGILGEVVTTGVGASMDVEIVVLEGDSDYDEADKWSSDEINKKMVREWNGREVLQGNTIVTIKDGRISSRGECYKHLIKANIKSVMDLLTVNAINPERLKEILEVNPNTWKVIMDHAQKCKDNTGIYLYHHPRDRQKSNGVVFNISGQLMGLTAESQFIPSNKLPYDKK